MGDALKDAKQKHVSDMLAAEEHVLDAIKRQRDTSDVKENKEANELIIEIERTINKHTASLNDLVEEKGADWEAKAKELVSGVLGQIAGLYDKARSLPLSRMLRDDYVALSWLTMGYTAMHGWALSVGDARMATLAQENLKDYTPLMVRCSKLLPAVAIQEAGQKKAYPVDETQIADAVRNTQEAWKPEVAGQAS